MDDVVETDEGAKGFRLIRTDADGAPDVKVFPAKGVLEGADQLLERELARMTADGSPADVYEVPDYATMWDILNRKETFAGVKPVRFCAGGRGYVTFMRNKPGKVPPEDAVRKVLMSAPALPPWVGHHRSSVTVSQTAENPEGSVTDKSDFEVPPCVDLVDVDTLRAGDVRQSETGDDRQGGGDTEPPEDRPHDAEPDHVRFLRDAVNRRCAQLNRLLDQVAQLARSIGLD